MLEMTHKLGLEKRADFEVGCFQKITKEPV